MATACLFQDLSSSTKPKQRQHCFRSGCLLSNDNPSFATNSLRAPTATKRSVRLYSHFDNNKASHRATASTGRTTQPFWHCSRSTNATNTFTLSLLKQEVCNHRRYSPTISANALQFIEREPTTRELLLLHRSLLPLHHQDRLTNGTTKQPKTAAFRPTSLLSLTASSAAPISVLHSIRMPLHRQN